MNITLNDLVDAGVHFGHQLRRFDPASKPFVFDHRNGISIINLEKTYQQLEQASNFLKEIVASGKSVMLIGTKKQAQEIVRETGTDLGMPYAASRWLGGGLTNFATVKNSLKKYRSYLEMENKGELVAMSNKKEVAAIRREMSRMHRNFEGIVHVNELPAAIFVIDAKQEQIALHEARRMGIPSVAIVDTNSDPSTVDYPIAGNDDSVKSIQILVDTVAEAIREGLALREGDKVVEQIDFSAQEQVFEEQVQPEVRISAEIEEEVQPYVSQEKPPKSDNTPNTLNS